MNVRSLEVIDLGFKNEEPPSIHLNGHGVSVDVRLSYLIS